MTACGQVFTFHGGYGNLSYMSAVGGRLGRCWRQPTVERNEAGQARDGCVSFAPVSDAHRPAGLCRKKIGRLERDF